MKPITKNFLSLSTLQAVNYLFPLITLPYLLRILGADNYGLMVFAAAFTGYFGIITEYGFNLSASRVVSVNRDNKSKLNEIFSSVYFIKLSLFLFSLIIFSLLLFTIPFFSQNKLIYLLSFIAIFGQTLYPGWFFQGMEKMEFDSFVSIAVKALSVAAIFIFIKNPQQLPLLIIINGASTVAISLIGFFYIKYKYRVKWTLPSLSVNIHYLKEGYYYFISSLSISLYNNSTLFLLGLLAGNTYVGYYSVADKIRLLVTKIFIPLSQSIYPHMAYLFTKSIDEAIFFVKKIMINAGAVNLIICTLLFLFAGELIPLVAGSQYTEAIPVLRVIAFLPFIVFLSNLLGVQTMLNLGYRRTFFIIVTAGGLISIILSFILIPHYKALGMAVTIFITETFILTLMAIKLAGYFKKKPVLNENV